MVASESLGVSAGLCVDIVQLDGELLSIGMNRSAARECNTCFRCQYTSSCRHALLFLRTIRQCHLTVAMAERPHIYETREVIIADFQHIGRCNSTTRPLRNYGKKLGKLRTVRAYLKCVR